VIATPDGRGVGVRRPCVTTSSSPTGEVPRPRDPSPAPSPAGRLDSPPGTSAGRRGPIRVPRSRVPIADDLAGRRTAVTGVTGFVGQALLAQLLAHVPDVELVLLARAGRAGSAADRIATLLRQASAFTGSAAVIPASPPPWRGCTSSTPTSNAPTSSCRRSTSCCTWRGRCPSTRRSTRPSATHTTGVHAAVPGARAAGLRRTSCTCPPPTSRRCGRARSPRNASDGDHRLAGRGRRRARLAERRARLAQPARLARFLDEARQRVGAHGDRRSRRRPSGAPASGSTSNSSRRAASAPARLGFSDVYTMTKALGERVAEERCSATLAALDRASDDRRVGAIATPTRLDRGLQGRRPAHRRARARRHPRLPRLPRQRRRRRPGRPRRQRPDRGRRASPPPAGRPRYVTVGDRCAQPDDGCTACTASSATTSRATRCRDGGDGTGHRCRRGASPGPTASSSSSGIATKRHPRASRSCVQPVGRPDAPGRPHPQPPRTAGPRARAEVPRPVRGLRRDRGGVPRRRTARRLRERLRRGPRPAFGFDPAEHRLAHYLTEVHVPAVTAPAALPGLPTATARPQPCRSRDPPTDRPPCWRCSTSTGRSRTPTSSRPTCKARWHDDRLAFARELADVLRTLPRYVALDAAGRERFLRPSTAGSPARTSRRSTAWPWRRCGDALLRDLNPAAVRRIREHRRVGHHTVLLTGALTSFCGPLDRCSTRSRPPSSRSTRGSRDRSPRRPAAGRGPGRARWLRTFARQVGADLAASYAYADSRSDVPLLRTVGNPVVVNPDLSAASARETAAVAGGHVGVLDGWVRSATDPTIPEPATSEREPATFEPGPTG
jgi:alcohol-forming fatty acyl-CoA reductase